MSDMAMEAWKARGRDLNALYDAIRAACTGRIPMTRDAAADVLRLGREAENLRDALRVLAACDDSLIPRDHAMDDLFARGLISWDGMFDATSMTKAGVDFVRATLADATTPTGDADA